MMMILKVWTCTGLHPLFPLPQLEVQSPKIKMTKSIRATHAQVHACIYACTDGGTHTHKRTHARKNAHTNIQIICFSPLLLLHFYLSLESLQSEKMVFDDDMILTMMMTTIIYDGADDDLMLIWLFYDADDGNLANINLATVNCIQSSDLLQKVQFFQLGQWSHPQQSTY